MLPSPRPEMSAEPTMNKNGRARRPFLCSFSRGLLLHADRHDLIIDELRPHVVVLVQRIVLLRAEGLAVGLDETVVAVDLVVAVPHLRSIGRSGVLDRERR